MDWLIDALLTPVALFFDNSNRLAVLYQATALLAAIGVYSYNQAQKNGAVELGGLLRWLLPRDVILHPSAKADYLYFVVNKILFATVFSSAAIGTYLVHDWALAALEAGFGPAGPGVAPSFAVSALCTVLVIVVLDFALWFAHYIYHMVPTLWEFHKVHHSAEVMTPITAARMHPVEELSDAAIGALTLGGVVALVDYVAGDGARMFTLFEMNVFMAAFFLAAFNLRHSHVWLRYPTWLQYIFVCPAQHQIHHSTARQHWDKNMGFIFAFWDWAAGTLYVPKGREEITFGLGTDEDGTWRSVRVLYFRPFAKVWGRLTGRHVAASAPAPATEAHAQAAPEGH